ncbi:hypothetical protein C1646_761896 [Rhizophagus diaphanus]|nr:hypothetical protein C1646_761896 [Rhizophagus diaphanus] [Rhizophagus sp. MUCL 43196]
MCWNEDPLKRPSSEKVLNTIKEWIFLSYSGEIKRITKELKCIDCLNFTSDNLNGILESEDSQASGISDDLNDCIINN